MQTSTKRLIPSHEVDALTLGRDALRYHGWDAEAVRARYEDLDANASYELEAVFACERSEHRVLALRAAGADLVQPITLTPGGATTVRVAVPGSAIKAGVLDVAIERREGPDAAVSELRLFGSSPSAPIITVVGDSRGGLIGTLSDAEYAGVADAEIAVAWPGGELRATTDGRGVFRVPLSAGLPLGQQAELRVTSTTGGLAATCRVDSKTIARGLRELPPEASRLSLEGDWHFLAGRLPDPTAAKWREAETTRVPGHVAFDGLIPDRGVATLRRAILTPADWAGDAVFARFDGAYGRAEIFVNGVAAGTHSAGATSFDVDLTPFLTPGENVLTVVLTEYTPHAVLDYMSWYAHISLLGIWREAFLFHVPTVHLGPTDVRADWDVQQRGGSLEFATTIINLGAEGRAYTLELSVSDAGTVLHRATLRGEATAAGSVIRRIALQLPDIEPWSAEIPRRYDLEVRLQVAGGRTAFYHRRIGFRRVEVSGNQLLVNGAPIRLVGVNRHDARMRTGRSMRYEDLRHDVLALRQANVNIIRTAHYPADPRLLDLCDELGMYVQDQMPICFAAGFDDHHWTRTNDAANLVPIVLEVTAETIGRDQVHPSVIIWDLANETQWGWGFDVQLALVREMDPSRPTIFSFDLNQLSDVNPLPHMRPEDRPDIRTYHYPGWDRSWQEDVDWLGSYDQPVVLDECVPPFQDNARAPLHADMLRIDPGVRDYWVSGVRPFMARAMRERGLIGGMIWSAVDDQWVLPIEESVGFGNWAHLTKLDYYRVRDVHPPQDGLTFRGEGEWGLLDGWGRSRPELWHTQKMYSPIEIVGASFDDGGDRLDLVVLNRHSHRRLQTLNLRVTGGTVDAGAADISASPEAAPGSTARFAVTVEPGAMRVEVAFWHPEGWLVDAFSWEVPGRVPDVRAAVRDGADIAKLALESAGDAIVSGAGPWLASWPRFHIQDANHPAVPFPVPVVDRSRARAADDGTLNVPLSGQEWEGLLTARVDATDVAFEYTCTYSGDQEFDAREIGLAFDLSPSLSDLWWHRLADWTAYPAGHIGRPRGYAPSAPAPADPLRPAERWEQDTTPSGTNDYRSAKRSILAAGVTDGRQSVSVLSDGSQHVRATIADGGPVLHVLDWYGGVPLTMDTEHIWTAYFGTGRRIKRGTTLQGRIVLACGRLPDAARRGGPGLRSAEGISSMTLAESAKSGETGDASTKPPSTPRRRRARWSRTDRRNLMVGLAFISPWLIGFALLTLYPTLATLYYSFTDFKILQAPRWVGFANYVQMFHDPLFWKSLWNTLYLTLIGTPLSVMVALGIAMLLNIKGIWGLGVFRTVFFLPVIFPAVAASILWLWLLNPPYGLVNQLLALTGIHGPGWFYDAAWAKNGIVLITIWAAGDVIIIYLGALQGVPRLLYEAAEVDGAGLWSRFRHVTIPMISPAILFNLVTQGIAAFQSFDKAYVVSQGIGINGAAVGGTQNSLLFYGLNLYNAAFRYFHMGYASALAWVLLVIILLATFALLRLSRNRVYYEGEP